MNYNYHYKCNIENIKTLLQSGLTYTEIALQEGVTKQRVQQLAKRLGINPLKIRQGLENTQYQQKWGNRQETDLYKAHRDKFFGKKANAKRSGYEWSIEFGQVTFPTHCPILGIELEYFAEGRQENSPSFDRLNNSRGYLEGNVRIISWRANRIKNDGTSEEHRKIADYLDKQEEELF